MGDERIENQVQVSLEDGVQAVQGEPDSVIRDSALWEIVGSDFFASVA
jgi:hypothetical protein